VGCSSPAHWPLSPYVDRPLSLWCMASETPDLRLPSHPQSVTAPWPVASTKLYCLVTEAHVCEQLAQTCCLAMHQPGVERVTSRSQVRQPNHYTTEPLTLSFNQLNSCFAVWCHSCNITELVIPNEILCGVKLHMLPSFHFRMRAFACSVKFSLALRYVNDRKSLVNLLQYVLGATAKRFESLAC